MTQPSDDSAQSMIWYNLPWMSGGGFHFEESKAFGTQQQQYHRNLKLVFFSLQLQRFFFPHTINLSFLNYPWNKHQRLSGRCDSFAPPIRSRSQTITKTIMRSLTYRLRKMEPLSLFPPPVQGSRSIWRSGIALRSCSCCSSGVQRSPHRFPLSHELKAHTSMAEWIWCHVLSQKHYSYQHVVHIQIF